MNRQEILAVEELLPEDGALQKADGTVTTERLRDVVKKQTRDGSTFAVYILENQSMVDYSMLIRIKVFDLNKVKDFSSFKTALRTIFEFYSYRKSAEALRQYLSCHEAEVKALDEESRFLLTTMIKEKRLFRKLAKKEKKEGEDMCEAIQGMIEEGIAQGKAEGILIILSEYGVVSKYLDEKIRNEKDMEILNKWFRLAIKAKTISEFESAM